MDQLTPVLVIIPNESAQAFASQISGALGYSQAQIVVGGPLDAINTLRTLSATPQYIVLDIGSRSADVLPEIDTLAEHCEPGTRVVVIGSVNDVAFYRELKQRGVIEYFPHPAKVADVRAALINFAPQAAGKSGGAVITCMSAASGDGSSTVALNTAYCLAEEFRQPTVLIDMDYQFGMIAKNLDLDTPFGIKELFEHPDRGIDSTLIKRMLAGYGNNLKIVAAPGPLRLLPTVRPEAIRDLILSLQEQYKYIVIDLPHIWTNWVSAAISNSTRVTLVAQLWLRSVTHASRLLSVFDDIGVEKSAISLVINRSGAKFKEAVGAKDFERVCGKAIDFYLSNDIKTVVEAENQGKTILEVSQSPLARQIKELSDSFLPDNLRGQLGDAFTADKKNPISSLFKR